jgi:hypothetical protein
VQYAVVYSTLYTVPNCSYLTNFTAYCGNFGALATASFATDNASATIYTEAYTGYAIHRAFLLFDTSSIPANARITAATLTLYKNATAISNGDLSSCCLVGSTPASNTAVQDVDFDQTGTTRLATDVTYASMTINTAFTFTLNADGLAAKWGE